MKFQSGDRIRDGLFRTLLVVAAKTIGTTQLLTLYPLESKHDKTIFQDVADNYELDKRTADPDADRIQKEMRWATQTKLVVRKKRKKRR
jgi:hypothetical protein